MEKTTTRLKRHINQVACWWSLFVGLRSNFYNIKKNFSLSCVNFKQQIGNLVKMSQHGCAANNAKII